MSVDTTKQVTIEDVIDRSRELGLTLPKNQMEAIKESLEKGTMSGQEHMQHLEKVSEKLADKGLRWATPESHAPNQPLHYLVDKHSNVQVYIMERTNSETKETFYAASRKSFDSEKNREVFVNMRTNNSVDSLKSNIAAYYTGAAIKEVAKEAEKNLVKETPEKAPQAPKATPSHDYSLSR
jgi:hypothetical protein